MVTGDIWSDRKGNTGLYSTQGGMFAEGIELAVVCCRFTDKPETSGRVGGPTNTEIRTEPVDRSNK